MTKKQGYLNYIHLFRGFAILIIVGIHCRISFRWTEESVTRDIFITILDNGTVLFVFIAGFLFQYLRNKFDYTSYLERKFKYVILPYLIVSAPAIAYDLYFDNRFDILPGYVSDGSDLTYILYMLATGKHLGPFWFIPMIVLFYLISPVLVRLDRPAFYRLFFPIIFIAGLFTYRFGYFSNTLDSFIHYLPIYLFGMWGSRYRMELVHLRWSFILLLIMIYLGMAALEVLNLVEVPRLHSFDDPDNSYFLFNIAKLKVSILCIILLRVFYAVNRDVELFKHLGDYSFGIYFVHLYVITFIEKIIEKISPGFILNAFYFLLYVIIVTFISVVTVYIIKMIFKKNSRLVIGS